MNRSRRGSPNRKVWAIFGAVAGILAVPGTALGTIDFRQAVVPALSQSGPDPIAGAWGDYDGDGRPDLVMADLGRGVRLFRNEATGFTNVTSLLEGAGAVPAIGVCWIDYDNDGDLDLFVVASLGGGHELYRNLGNGRFERTAKGLDLLAPTRGMVGVWGDVNRDGLLDVFISNGGGAGQDAPGLFMGTGIASAPFQQVTQGSVTTVRSYGAAAAWADFDEDGWLDLMSVSAVSGPNPFYRNSGDGSLVLLSPGPIESAGGPKAGAGAAWGDFDNDGDLDLLLTSGYGDDALYRNNGDGSFSLVPGEPGVSVGSTVGVVWADFDNDGWLDLVLGNRGGRPALFRNLGNGHFGRIQTGPLPNQTQVSNGVAVGDYNGDGFLDVVLANWPGGAPTLYENLGNTNHWLKVRLQGIYSTRQGIGARVRLTTTIQGSERRLMRQIGGEDGWGTHEALAHFGLGDSTRVESLRVEWPSGAVTTLTNIPVDQVLTVEEAPGARLAIVPSGGVFTNVVRVLIRSFVAGGEVRYTLDGSEPTTDSPTYASPFDVRSRVTVRARVYLNGFPVSEVATAEFRPDPGLRIEPAEGRFTNSLHVALSTRIPGAVMRYTTDGTEPTIGAKAYEGPIRLTASTVVSVRAFFDGFAVSETVSGRFTRVYAYEGDGIPFAWREQYFGVGYELDPRASVEADPDADGSSNLQEYLVGSNPLDPLSGFGVGIRAVPEIRFQSVVGQRYRVVRRDTVSGQAVVVLDGWVATNAVSTLVDTSIQNSAGFYVVEPVQ